MRLVRFRGRRLDNGHWVYGMPIKTHIGTFIITEENPHVCNQYGYMEIDEFAEVDPDTVGQFSGLTDVAGARIYEGDILCWGNTDPDNPDDFQPFRLSAQNPPFVCKWLGNGFTLLSLDCEPEIDDYVQEAKEHFKIIGNIHTNPEILKDYKNDDTTAELERLYSHIDD